MAYAYVLGDSTEYTPGGHYDVIDYSLLDCFPIIDYGFVSAVAGSIADYDVITASSTVTIDYKYTIPCRLPK